MSRTCKLKENTMEYLRFEASTTVDELREFVGTQGTLHFFAERVEVEFDGYNLPLDDGDVLVRITDDVEVYTEQNFERYFE